MRIIGNNIFIVRGDTGLLKVSISDRSNKPILFGEGDTLFLTVKTSPKTRNISFQKVIEIEEETDLVSIDIDPDDTKRLSFGDYVYDIQLTRANGDVHTIIMPSKFTIGDEVTYD